MNPTTGVDEYAFPLMMLGGMRIDTQQARTIGVRYVQAFERKKAELGTTADGRLKLHSISAPLMDLAGMPRQG